MQELEDCNTAWRKHLEKNKLLLLFLNDKIRKILEKAFFIQIKEVEYGNRSGIMIYFRNEGVKYDFMVFCSTTGWGPLINKGLGSKNHYSLKKGSTVCALLDNFEWNKFIPKGDKDKKIKDELETVRKTE